MSLTEAFVKSLTAPTEPGKSASYYDCDIPELYIRVAPDGTKTWTIKTMVHGKQFKVVLGGYPGVKPVEARARATEDLRNIRQEGLTPCAIRKAEEAAKQAAVLVSDLADRYIREHIQRHNKPSTQDEAIRRINKRIIPAFGKMCVKNVGRDNISKFLYGINTQSPTTARLVRSDMKLMFDFAIEWGMLPPESNPVTAVKLRTKPVKRRRRLSDLELKALGTVLRESQESRHILIAIRMALLAGMRKSEVLNLRWEWVDLENGIVTLPPEAHKTGDESDASTTRVIHLCSALVNDLESMTATLGNPFVFPGKPNPDGPTHLENLQAQWERIREKVTEDAKEKNSDLSILDVHLHDLRRSFSSIGKDLTLGGFVGELLGHAAQTVTDIYTRASSQRLHDVAEEIGARIDGILSGRIDPEKEIADAKEAKAKLKASQQTG